MGLGIEPGSRGESAVALGDEFAQPVAGLGEGGKGGEAVVGHHALKRGDGLVALSCGEEGFGTARVGGRHPGQEAFIADVDALIVGLGFGESVGRRGFAGSVAECDKTFGGGLAAPSSIGGDGFKGLPSFVEATEREQGVTATEGDLPQFETRSSLVHGDGKKVQGFLGTTGTQGHLAKTLVTEIGEYAAGVGIDDALEKRPGGLGLADAEQVIADLAQDAGGQGIGGEFGGDAPVEFAGAVGLVAQNGDFGLREKHAGDAGGRLAGAVVDQERLDAFVEFQNRNRRGGIFLLFRARRLGKVTGELDQQPLDIVELRLGHVAAEDACLSVDGFTVLALAGAQASDPVGGVYDVGVVGIFAGKIRPDRDGGVVVAACLMQARELVENVAEEFVGQFDLQGGGVACDRVVDLVGTGKGVALE